MINIIYTNSTFDKGKIIFLMVLLLQVCLQLQLAACDDPITEYPQFYGFNGTEEGWTQSADDDIDWLFRSNETPSINTGPLGPFEGAQYTHIESSFPNYPSKAASLISPRFLFPYEGSPSISFAYHMYGSTVNSLTLDISTDDGVTWQSVWTRTGNQGNGWFTADVDLSAFQSSFAKLRFTAVSGSSWDSDIAIDNVQVNMDFPTACANTIVSNGGFESGGAGWVLGGGANIDTNDENSGTSALELDDPLDYVYQNISVTPRQTLLTSFYSKTLSSAGDGVFGLNFKNSAGTIIGNAEVIVKNENVYSYYSFISLVPDDAVSVDVFMERRAGTNSNYYFDDICIEIGNTIPIANDNEFSVSNANLVHTSNLLSDDEGNGVDSDADADNLDVLVVAGSRNSAVAVQGIYGSLTWSSNGSIEYTLDELDPDFAAIPCGAVASESFTYVIDDAKAGRDTAEILISVEKVLLKPDAGGSRTVCAFEPVVFSTMSMNQGANYNWDFGSNATPGSGVGIGPHTVSFLNDHLTGNNQVFDIVLTTTDGICTELDTSVVTVRAVPSISLTYSNPDCITDKGSISFAFSENTSRTTLSLSLDNGITYPYSFSDNLGTYIIPDLDPGTYEVWARWGNSQCPIYMEDVTITSYSPPVLDAMSGESICIGETIVFSANVTGGIAPYAYTWNQSLGAGSSQSVSPLVTTSYSVTVVDGNGCQDVTTVQVVVNNLPVGSLDVEDSEICDNESTQITVEPAGLFYNWSANTGNATLQTVVVSPVSNSGLPASTPYTVTVTDGNGCKDTVSTQIVANGNPTVAVDNDTICYAATGALIPLYSGISPFTYEWQDGSIGPTITETLIANKSFAVTVTDNNGCTTAAEADIVVNPELLILINEGVPEIGLCEGLDLTLVSNVTGGTGTMTYLWNESLGTAPNVVAVPVDTTLYQVTVTDSRGCNTTSSLIINPVPQIVASSSNDVNVCEGELVILSATGGEDYLWSDGQTGSSITVSPSETTTYEVDVTDSYGCYDDEEIIVTVSPEMSSAMDYNGSECLTNSTEISGVVNGGVGPYSYLWVGPEGLAGLDQTIPVDTNGNYYVTITDDFGCESYASGFVYERYLPSIVNLQANICEGDGVTLSLAESNVNTYQWSNNTGGSTSASVVVFPSPPSENYFVTVTNDVGCTAVASSEILVNPKPLVSFVESATVCNGSISDVLPNMGGIWFSSNAAVAIVNNQGKTIATGPGSAALTFIESLYGCQSDPLVINVSANPTVSASPDQTICNGDLITISASGIGNGNLTYRWNEDLGLGESKTFVPLGSDTIRAVKDYVVTVTDENGCTQQDDLSVTIKSNPAPIVSKGDETCGLNNAFVKFDFINHPQRNTVKLSIDAGESWLELSDNLGSYTYENRAPGIYELRARWGEDDCEIDLGAIALIPDPLPSAFVNTDNGTCGTVGEGVITLSFIDNINRSTLQVSLDGGATYPYSAPDNIGNYVIDNLDPGIYDIWLRWGDDSCPTDIEDAEILLATVPDATATADTSLCEGSLLLLAASGGSTYDWNDGSSGSPITVNPESTTTYVVTVTTEAGCTDTESVVVQVSPELIIDISSNGTVCITDSTKLTVSHSGGFSPFLYNWQGPAGLVSSADTINASINGNYSVTVTDAKGCEAITSALIYEEYEAFILNVATDVCEGDMVSLSATASSGDFYSWNVLPDSNLQSIVVTPAVPNTEYFVTVTNSVGCQAVASANINVDPSPDISLSGDDFVCVGSTTTLIGPSAGIWISSDPNVAIVGSNGVVTGLTPGEAFFTFIDLATGCQSLDFLSIEVGALPPSVITGETVICIGDTTNLSPTSGGVWMSSDTTIAMVSDSGYVTALSSGLVNFTFTNTNGCTATTSQSLLIQPRPIILSPDNEDICIGGTTNIYPSQGGLWYSSNPAVATVDNLGKIVGVSPGTVRFYFTDLATSCISNASDTVTVLPPPAIEIVGVDSMCLGSSTTLSPSTGGTWSSENPQIATVTNSGVVTGVNPGSVRFRYTSSIDGCISDYSDPVIINPDPVLTNQGSSFLCIGSTTQYLPSSGGTWTSSNPAVATIDDSGLVTAVASGNVNFTYTDFITLCSSTTVPSLSISSNPEIELNGPSQLCIGSSTVLQPSSGGVWTSANSSIATISNGGNVTAVSAGLATFTFRENSTGCESSQSLSITVLPKPVATITGVDELCIDGNTTVSPVAGGVWNSSNSSVATVTNSGVVTGIAAGGARFTFISEDGCVSNQTPPVLVNNSPQVTLVGPKNICEDGFTSFVPASGGTWESNDTLIATITDAGVVLGISPGSVTFVFTDSVTGCISDPTEAIIVDGRPLVTVSGDDNVCIGQSTNVAPTVGGVWVSNDPSVASVSNSGFVLGLAVGSTSFVFTEAATGCSSLPTDPIAINAGSSVSIVGADNICIGSTTTLSPSTGGTWISTNQAVAQVTSAGVVTGLSQGIARFRFTDSSTGCQSSLTAPLTVSDLPAVSFIAGSNVCIGGEISVSPSTGGSWISSDPSIATITNEGVITGVSAGSVQFTFTDGETGCTNSGLLLGSVSEPSNVAVSGATEICIGSITNLSPTTGGTWTSSNPSIATVSNQGVVQGVSPGVVTFEFTDGTSGCALESITEPVQVESCVTSDINVTTTSFEIQSSLATNDGTPAGTYYNPSFSLLSKPTASLPILIIQSDGSYTFSSTTPGKYVYTIPVCLPPSSLACVKSLLEITVLDNVFTNNNLVSNMDMAATYTGNTASVVGNPVLIQTLVNDQCVRVSGCSIDSGLSTISRAPSFGTATIDEMGDITYVPQAGFIGSDTLEYTVCLDGDVSMCSSSKQIITVRDLTANNSIYATDDFDWTSPGESISGNLFANDGDAEVDIIQVNPVGSALLSIQIEGGSYYIDDLGNYTFTPQEGYTGYTEVVYTVCDNNVDQACTDATLHLLVFDDLTVPLKVYLEGALMTNRDEKAADGRPLMRDDLRVNPFDGNNYIPIVDPYTVPVGLLNFTARFPKVGPALLPENQVILDSAAVFSVTGPNAIVDWVFVEIREKSDSTIILGSRAGLLQRDGDVVDLDGTSNLRFKGVSADSFYVVVNHRSHLAAMSMLVGNGDLVDFTRVDEPLFDFGFYTETGLDYTGLATNNSVKNGYRALWAGDFDSNGVVKYENPSDDQNILFFDVLSFSENVLGTSNYDFGYSYADSDFNMNGKAKYDNPNDDKNMLFFQIIIYPLNGQALSNFSSIIEQVPR